MKKYSIHFIQILVHQILLAVQAQARVIDMTEHRYLWAAMSAQVVWQIHILVITMCMIL
uniref:Uncharacterized protein n=1 Tax=Arundo donax TaxID=35708 RepID=A0A0A9DWL4_ARUDO